MCDGNSQHNCRISAKLQQVKAEEVKAKRDRRNRLQRENSKYWLCGPFLLGPCTRCGSSVYDAQHANSAYVRRFTDDYAICGTMIDAVVVCDECIGFR